MLVVLAAVCAILVMTGMYFVATLGKLAGHDALTDAQITGISRTWLLLNIARAVLLLALLGCALVALVRLVRPRAASS